MLDIQGVLSEYLPLQLVSFGDVYADEAGDPNAWLDEYDFVWQPVTSDGDMPQLYLGDAPMRFAPKDRGKKASLQKRLNQQPLRMPMISDCWGSQSLMITNELADQLHFSDVLGVTRTPAQIEDASGSLHGGYTAFSFHKAFLHDRVTQRFEQIPVELRPIIRLRLVKHRTTYLIHQSLLKHWLAQGVEDLSDDFDDAYLQLANLLQARRYSFHCGTRSFANMDDFQHNRNGSVY
ncbi:hypothetical protein VST7929_01073 [Vibrio stylophorae]|uniref:Uncharacterized protein n=1 Tax=Vibrio stylophorae TaxID=659351 RepID=A0ABN8DSJ5_9VIBR|nr:hypothetical protein [Vibrio stylophorae]CAH0533209.1 hypothetical protein VST7929_01073 [Vibrio stylophorae]